MIMHIYTNEYSCHVYHVNMKNGNIWYNGLKPSGDWKFTGFSHLRRNEIIKLAEIVAHPDIVKSSDFWFKNGKSQYKVRDLDHGTTREWGSRITGILFSEESK